MHIAAAAVLRYNPAPPVAEKTLVSLDSGPYPCVACASTLSPNSDRASYFTFYILGNTCSFLTPSHLPPSFPVLFIFVLCSHLGVPLTRASQPSLGAPDSNQRRSLTPISLQSPRWRAPRQKRASLRRASLPTRTHTSSSTRRSSSILAAQWPASSATCVTLSSLLLYVCTMSSNTTPADSARPSSFCSSSPRHLRFPLHNGPRPRATRARASWIPTRQQRPQLKRSRPRQHRTPALSFPRPQPRAIA